MFASSHAVCQDEARILEERRREEQARLEREEALRREQAEKERKETERREAAERLAEARGRGATRGTRGRGRACTLFFLIRVSTWVSSTSLFDPVPPGTRSRTPTASATSRTTTAQVNSASARGRGTSKIAIPSGLRAPTAGRALARGTGRGARGS